MPVSHITLEDLDRLVLSPVYNSVVADVARELQIPSSALTVLYRDMETTLTDNKTNVSTQQPNNIPTTVSKRRFAVTITEDYNEDELATTTVHQMNAEPIFHDAELEVSIYPIYVSSNVSLEFAYTSPSKQEVTRLRDELRLKISQFRNRIAHAANYMLLLPEELEDFVCDVHERRNRIDPSELGTYFLSRASASVFMAGDLANKEAQRLAFGERQGRIMGYYDFGSFPEKFEVDNETGTYRLSFAYKFTFDVVRALGVRYPVMLCNRLMPNKYIEHLTRNNREAKSEEFAQRRYTGAMRALGTLEAQKHLGMNVDTKLPLNIPDFDEFNQKESLSGYLNLTSVLTDVDETDRKGLFSLRELGDYSLESEFMHFLTQGERNYITQAYQSVFYLGLCQSGRYFSAPILELTPELFVQSTETLSLMRACRVTLSVCVDLAFVMPGATRRLMSNKAALMIFLREFTYLHKYCVSQIPHSTRRSTNNMKFLYDVLNMLTRQDDLELASQVISLAKTVPIFDAHLKSISSTLPRVLVEEVSRPLELGLATQSKAVPESSLRRVIGGGILQTTQTNSVQAYRK